MDEDNAAADGRLVELLLQTVPGPADDEDEDGDDDAGGGGDDGNIEPDEDEGYDDEDDDDEEPWQVRRLTASSARHCARRHST
jgi:hypothetical protein